MAKKTEKKGAPNLAAKAKKKRAEQLQVPGTERKSIKDLDTKASEIRDTEDEIEELKKSLAQGKKDLLGLMKKHEQEVYVYFSNEGVKRKVRRKSKSSESVEVIDIEDEE